MARMIRVGDYVRVRRPEKSIDGAAVKWGSKGTVARGPFLAPDSEQLWYWVLYPSGRGQWVDGASLAVLRRAK